MGKQIRRTITITLVETWTFVWTPDDDPAGHPATLVQHQPITEEETNETLQATLTPTEPDKPGRCDPPATPLASDAALDLLPGNTPSNATTSRKRKRSRRPLTRSDPCS